MDQITTAIVSALSAGAASGLTETSKTAITDAYTKLKDLLTTKFGAKSAVKQALDGLQAKPESDGRRKILQEELTEVKAEQDSEILALATQLQILVPSQTAGKYIINNLAPVGKQIIGDTITIR